MIRSAGFGIGRGTIDVPGSSLNRCAHECRKTMNIVLRVDLLVGYIRNEAGRKANLQTALMTSDMRIEHFAATPARLAFSSPSKLPIL